MAAVRELLGRGARVAHLLALHGLEGLVGERLHVALRRRELTTCRIGAHTTTLVALDKITHYKYSTDKCRLADACYVYLLLHTYKKRTKDEKQ